jgi:hypothetical protein
VAGPDLREPARRVVIEVGVPEFRNGRQRLPRARAQSRMRAAHALDVVSRHSVGVSRPSSVRFHLACGRYLGASAERCLRRFGGAVPSGLPLTLGLWWMSLLSWVPGRAERPGGSRRPVGQAALEVLRAFGVSIGGRAEAPAGHLARWRRVVDGGGLRPAADRARRALSRLAVADRALAEHSARPRSRGLERLVTRRRAFAA